MALERGESVSVGVVAPVIPAPFERFEPLALHWYCSNEPFPVTLIASVSPTRAMEQDGG
jgi:hypothetical protein